MAKNISSHKTVFIYVVFCTLLLVLSIGLCICLIKEFSEDQKENNKNTEIYISNNNVKSTVSNNCSLFEQYLNIIVKLSLAFIGGVLVSDGDFIKLGAI